MCCNGSMPYSTQPKAGEILERKENVYHTALNHNFRPQGTGREAGLAHSTSKTAVRYCPTGSPNRSSLQNTDTCTIERGVEGRETEGRCADLLVSRPEKFIVTTQSKYLLKLMKRFVKLILFLQVVKEETDELEIEEPEDEADRKLGGPLEMDLKVLYTYLTYRNVFG